MAVKITQGGGVKNYAEQGTTVESIAVPAPGKGYANRIRKIIAVQRGGTSVRMIVNLQHSASTEDPTGLNIDIGYVQRVAGQVSQYILTGGTDKEGLIGGENQQTTVGVSGDVNDSTVTALIVVADTVKV